MNENSFKEKDFYKQKIIDMVGEIENPDCIYKIYHYILAKYRRMNNEKETGV